jgi:citrate lyase subunit beta/citryl-CoA lyase
MQRLRSLLFTPGHKPAMVAKAFTSAADGVIVDLEDAVPVDQKPAARAGLAALPDPGGREVFVRVNGVTTGLLWGDLTAAVEARPAGVILPKAERPEDVLRIDGALLAAEDRAGVEPGSTALLLLIESALGLVNAYEMARASSRVASLIFASGEEGDLVADLGVSWSLAGPELLTARSQMVIAARAAGLDFPLDAVYMNIRDLDGLRAEAELAKRLGLTGKLCVHPAQIPVVNEVFSPSAEEIAEQRRILEAFEKALAEGSGAVLLDGKMIDYANANRARRILALAGESEIGDDR